ncbi:MAG: S-methyl-5'-thioadenosine phosphorylase [Bacteriovoracia bacterium]
MIGIIGGTGLYQIEGLEVTDEKQIETPFGNPSAKVVIGSIGGNRAAFLPRHGVNHGLLPGEINFRANIWALKSVGVQRVVSVSAVGSLVQGIEPGHLVIPDQYLDFTKGKRIQTFFGNGMVAHISTAEPTCPVLTSWIHEAGKELNTNIHFRKTYACVEGPRLGTRAESFFLRQANSHVVGMTNVPEAFLAREAQLCYSTIAVVTDYDCWLDDPSQHASVDKVIALYKSNLGRVQNIIAKVLTRAPSSSKTATPCTCGRALEGAVLTSEAGLSLENKNILEFLRR